MTLPKFVILPHTLILPCPRMCPLSALCLVHPDQLFLTLRAEHLNGETVLERIESEFESEISMVRKTAALGLEQFIESGQKSLAWFLEQSTMETEYGVQSSLAEASAYGSQAGYAQTASILGAGAAGMSGAAQYGTYQESLKKPMTIQ